MTAKRAKLRARHGALQSRTLLNTIPDVPLVSRIGLRIAGTATGTDASRARFVQTATKVAAGTVGRSIPVTLTYCRT